MTEELDEKRKDMPDEDYETAFGDSRSEEGQASPAAPEAPVPKGKWFGRGIYGSKDVPIRLLDGLIVGLLAAILLLTIIFAINGGYRVTFDTVGGSELEYQKVRHGEHVKDPGVPVKAGYVFDGWYQEGSPENGWFFDINKVGADDMTLVARWVPAKVTVKFDLAGGALDGASEAGPLEVTFGEIYGGLPVPSKDGAEFKGWLYSGQMITSDTVVSVNGEHVLTAVWE